MIRQERLQKVLSQAGLGSRREMERWIEQGWIQINGQTAQLGVSVSEKDILSVKGRVIDNPLKLTQRVRVLLYHKPIGEISSRRDPKHPQTVFDHLPPLRQGRWIQVGRLDLNTSGLLLFTNDGELAHRLMHPKHALEREYAVRVYGEVKPEQIQALSTGVKLEDGVAKFHKITYRGGEGTNGWYHVVLHEGKNREVRRLWESQGVAVSRLIRIRYGQFHLPRSLSRGEYLELPTAEVTALLEKWC